MQSWNNSQFKDGALQEARMQLHQLLSALHSHLTIINTYILRHSYVTAFPKIRNICMPLKCVQRHDTYRKYSNSISSDFFFRQTEIKTNITYIRAPLIPEKTWARYGHTHFSLGCTVADSTFYVAGPERLGLTAGANTTRHVDKVLWDSTGPHNFRRIQIYARNPWAGQ